MLPCIFISGRVRVSVAPSVKRRNAKSMKSCWFLNEGHFQALEIPNTYDREIPYVYPNLNLHIAAINISLIRSSLHSSMILLKSRYNWIVMIG